MAFHCQSIWVILQASMVVGTVLSLPCYAADAVGSGGQFDFRSNEGKQLISAAAALPADEFEAVLKGKRQNISDFHTQPLTALLLADVPGPYVGAAQAEEFNILSRDGLLSAAKVLNTIKDGSGGASFVQPQFIRNVAFVIHEREARGRVSFEAAGVFKGSVNFLAKEKEGVWRIAWLRLPFRGMMSVSNGHDIWKEVPILFNPGYAIEVGPYEPLPEFDVYFTWTNYFAYSSEKGNTDPANVTYFWRGENVGTGNSGIKEILRKLAGLPLHSRVLVYPRYVVSGPSDHPLYYPFEQSEIRNIKEKHDLVLYFSSQGHLGEKVSP